jgi:glycosyltransferase involved in cell wall biosynthesis
MAIPDRAKSIKDVSVLLPTRGRTKALRTSVESLLSLASGPQRLEILLAFDHDDKDSYAYFESKIAPLFDQYQSRYVCYGFDRLGYIRLNEYVNYLAAQAQGQWLMFWGDDAIMETQAWDQRIVEVDKFRVLRIPTHNQHPYAIFPIVPRAWYEICGYVSAHQLSDSWVSQIGYILDIVKNIDVSVTHDRFDITGNNQDDTWRNRPMLEGRPSDPRDFNHISWRQHRQQDCIKLAEYMRQQGDDMTWFDRVLAGEQDPWAKMCSPEYDPNRQVAIQPK